MTNIRTLFMIGLTALFAINASAASAYTTKNNLNHRPVDQIAAELGIDGQQFADCFARVSPAGPDEQPTGTLERNNKALLLPCLQAVNPSITNDLLDSVMNKYRGQYTGDNN